MNLPAVSGASPVIAFDAYGTLFDLGSPVRAVLSGSGIEVAYFSEVLRARQLEFAWTDSAIGRDTDFWAVTQRAIRATLQHFSLAPDNGLARRLAGAYESIELSVGIRQVLEELAARNAEVVVFSNASRSMLAASVDSAGVRHLVSELHSVDCGGKYKPHHDSYRHFLARPESADRMVWLVSSNAWDIAGASRAGMQTCWLNRNGLDFPYAPAAPTRAVVRPADIVTAVL